MPLHIDFADDLMMLMDADGHGVDAFTVDSTKPWDAVAALGRWGHRYDPDLDMIAALGVLRRYLKDCR